MKVLRINPNNPDKEVIKEVVSAIKNGKIIVYPTDTVYGLGCDALDIRVVERLFRVKQRSDVKPIPILVKDIKMAKKLAKISKEQEIFLRKVWPGKITVVFFKKDIVPDIVTAGSKKVGLRIPDYKFTNILMENLNLPITTTSANISGKLPSGNINEILSQFEGKLKPDLVLDAGILPLSQPSTVVDLSDLKPKIIRKGPVSKKKVLKILKAKK